MLVLSRKVDETIVINGNIRITVLKIRQYDGKIALGIEAPKDVTVHREEIQALVDKGEGRKNGKG